MFIDTKPTTNNDNEKLDQIGRGRASVAFFKTTLQIVTSRMLNWTPINKAMIGFIEQLRLCCPSRVAPALVVRN